MPKKGGCFVTLLRDTYFMQSRVAIARPGRERLGNSLMELTMSDKKIRCCGISFQDSPTTLLNIAMLQVPTLCLLAVISVVLLPIRLVFRKEATPFVLFTLLKAKHANIKNASLFPQLRCVLAGKVFSLSPRLSGLVFNGFNLAVFSTCWCIATVVLFLAWQYVVTGS